MKHVLYVLKHTMSSYVFWIFDSHLEEFDNSITVLDAVPASYKNYQDTMRRYMLELTEPNSNFKSEIYDASLCPKIFQCDKIKMGSYLLVAIRDKTAYKTPLQSFTCDVVKYLATHSFQSTRRHLSVGASMREDLLDNFHFRSFVIDWKGNIVYKETEWCVSIESYVPQELMSSADYIFNGYHTLGYKYKKSQAYRRFYEMAFDNVRTDVDIPDIPCKRLGFFKPLLYWMKKNSPLWSMLTLDVIKLVYNHLKSEDDCFILYHDPVIPSVKIDVPANHSSYRTSWESFIQDGKVCVDFNCKMASGDVSEYYFNFYFQHRPVNRRYNVIHIAIKYIISEAGKDLVCIDEGDVTYYDIRPGAKETEKHSCMFQARETEFDTKLACMKWQIIIYYGS